MAALNPLPYLWNNICSLMGEAAPSINRVQKRTGVGRGIIQRIHDGDTNVQVASLVAIARSFSVEPWQLMVPNIKHGDLPVLGEVKVVTASPLSSDLVAAIANSTEPERERVEAILRAALALPPKTEKPDNSLEQSAEAGKLGRNKFAA